MPFIRNSGKFQNCVFRENLLVFFSLKFHPSSLVATQGASLGGLYEDCGITNLLSDCERIVELSQYLASYGQVYSEWHLL